MITSLPTPEPGLAEHNPLPSPGLSGRWIDPVELAIGASIGHVRGLPQLLPDRSRTMREAMDAVIVQALNRPPCFVTFSGGRDSSTVLAIAVDVARRHGLPLPVPVTHRFPGAPDSNEDQWQLRTIRRLGLEDWHQLIWSDELDVIGPFAVRSMRATGIGSPFNQHFLLPLIDEARGGSLLTGIGGDELFELPTRRVANRGRYGKGTLRPREVPGFVAQQLPRPIRAFRTRRAQPVRPDWVTDRAARLAAARVASESSGQPVRYDRALLEWWWTTKALQLSLERLRRLAVLGDVAIVHPFADRTVLAALAGECGPLPPTGRARTLKSLAGHLLDDEVLSRTSKAFFDEAFGNSWTKTFAQRWTGGGVDPELVDPEALRSEWLQPQPHAGSFLLLQSAFLAETELTEQPN